MFAAVEFFIHFVVFRKSTVSFIDLVYKSTNCAFQEKKKVVFHKLGLYVKQHLQLLTPTILASNFEIFQKITHIN